MRCSNERLNIKLGCDSALAYRARVSIARYVQLKCDYCAVIINQVLQSVLLELWVARMNVFEATHQCVGSRRPYYSTTVVW